MKEIKLYNYKTAVGELILGDFSGQLCMADWRYRKAREAVDMRVSKGLGAELVPCDSPTELHEMVIAQFSDYFAENRTNFSIPLCFVGTDFQKSVWEALLRIPYGQTLTYLGLAKLLGDAKAIRAVAAANGANALSVVVPCHRIVGAQGELVGYAGGLAAKKRLLELERADCLRQTSLF